MSHYWIKKGTNNWTYQVVDEDTCELMRHEFGEDDYYDKIADYHVTNGMHVVDYTNYKKTVETLKEISKMGCDLIAGMNCPACKALTTLRELGEA